MASTVPFEQQQQPQQRSSPTAAADRSESISTPYCGTPGASLADTQQQQHQSQVPAGPDATRTAAFVEAFVAQLLAYVGATSPALSNAVAESSTPVLAASPATPTVNGEAAAVNFIDPTRLERELAPLKIAHEGADPQELLKHVTAILERSVNISHPRALNQLFHKADVIAVLGDWLTSALNTSIYTYELAPVATLLERECVQRYAELFGWDAETSEGAFPPGGSTSNLYGIAFARQKLFPEVRERGWCDADRPVLFTSAIGHYSSKKSVMLMGMGAASLVEVPVDPVSGAMLPTELDRLMTEAIAAGRRPMCVVATVGTTLTGSIDPVDEIADVCEKHECWLHIDGCLGGSLVHHPETRDKLLPGLRRADSVAVNAHKMMGVTLQCSAIVTRHRGIMRATFATNAQYLFNDDKQYDRDYDVGDAVFSCGRRVDCLKLWLTWRARGDVGMAAYVDSALQSHKLFNEVIDADPRFLAVLPEPSLVPCTCFWYVPEAVRNGAEFAGHTTIGATDAPAARALVSATETEAYAVIDSATQRAKRLLMERGEGIVTVSRMAQLPNFWRFVANGAHSWSRADIDGLLNDIASACEAAAAPGSRGRIES